MLLFLTRDALLRFSRDERRLDTSGEQLRSGEFSELRPGERVARPSQKVRGERLCEGDESKGDESPRRSIFWVEMSMVGYRT